MEKYHDMPSSDDGAEPSMKELLKALAKARAKLRAIELSGNFDGEDAYKYSTWADVCMALDPCLLPEGLVFVAKERITVHGWVMVGRLYHADSGCYLESTAPIRDQDSKDPRDWLGACTYARKGLYLELGGGYSRNPQDGQVAEEQPPVEPGVDVALELALDAQRDKVIAGFRLLRTPDKVAEGLVRAEGLVNQGLLRERDFKEIVKPYLEPKKEKKEVASAIG